MYHVRGVEQKQKYSKSSSTLKIGIGIVVYDNIQNIV